MKKSLKVFLLVLLVLVAAFFVMVNTLGNQMNEMEALDYGSIDMRRVPDGVYEGKKDTLLVKATVAVTVKDHQMERIDILRHVNGRGSAAEAVVPAMVAANSAQVDAVAGATMSSLALKAAVLDALGRAQQP